MERGGNYVLDSRLEHRIRSYLEANKSNKYVDVVEMADSLRNLYPEYGRKKRIPFRISVEKTFENIQSSMGVEDTEVINDDNFSESDADITELDPLASTEKQGGNQLMRSMYNKNNSKPSSSDNVNDDIFIIDTIGGNSPEDLEAESLPSLKTGKQPAKTAASRKNKKRKRTSDSDVDDEPMKDSKRPESHLQKATATFADVGGNRKTLEEVCWLLLHLKHPEIYNKLGICPPRGILLHGPPGSGKTLLANAIAGELDFPLCKVSAPEIVSGVSGESEEKIRTLFEEAITNAPCVLFLDEIDAITPKRETAQREMERRIVAQLLSCMDDLGSRPLTASVLVIGATNRPDALDPALRRAGRFDREIALGIPDQAARIHVLQVLTRNLALGTDIDWTYLGKRTPGFVGADLAALTREAAMASVNREMLTLRDKFVASKEAPEPEKSQPLQIESSEQPELHATTSFKVESTGEAAPAPSKQSMTLENLTSWLKEQTSYQPEQLQHLTIGMDDFVDALRVVQPSALREGFATVPDVTWDDVGALKSVREELEMAILAPVRHAEAFAALGVNSPSGVMLCGPPGCGKTLLAKAVANEAGINFISVKGPELLNMYVGESERAVRQCFQRARNSAPCVIFFDELDALCPKRSDHGEGGSSVRVVNQLLTEMDGLEARKGVYLMAATNRPDIIDPAVLRPGRLDKILYVGLPTVEDRLDILKAVTKNGTRPRLAPDVDFAAIMSHPKSENLTGADVAALVREAAVLALKELVFSSKMEDPASLAVHARHFQEALEKIKPSVSEKDLIKYERQRR